MKKTILDYLQKNINESMTNLNTPGQLDAEEMAYEQAFLDALTYVNRFVEKLSSAPTEDKIKAWVANNYGESECNEPSWNIEELAKYIENN